MLSLFRRFTALSGLVALVRGPMGQKAIAAAQRQLHDPRNRQRLADLQAKFRSTPR